MPSFIYVKEADLGPLSNAAGSWKALTAKYEGLGDEFSRRVTQHLKGHWEGDAADSAFATMKKAEQQYKDAATEAGRIGALLADAYTEFAKYQKALLQLVDEATSDNYSISEAGDIDDVDPRMDSQTASGTPGLAEERTDKLNSLRSRMKEILLQATAADEAAGAALQRDDNGKSDGFNTNVYTTLDAVEADEASALMKKKGRLSDAEITKLNNLLAANKNDPEFSRRFAVETGADNMLSKYNQLINPPAGTTLSKAEMAELKQLQKNLGTTIGTATTSDDKHPDPAITKFQNDLIDAGQRDFNANPTESSYGLNGFQLTSSLMSNGKWDTAFLQDYGDDLIAAEANGANAGQNPDTYWSGSGLRSLGSTNLGALDPMTGFMDALGHNPEASTEFLTSDSTANSEKIDHLDYLLKDRHWPEGAGYTGDSSNPSGYNNLGHAMESATTGRAYDDTDGAPVKHTAERAQLMDEIVKTIGSDPGLISDSPRDSMRDSLGNVTAEYMADVQSAMGNAQGTIKTFGVDAGLEDNPFLEPFLATVGQDPDAYAAITEASQANTAIWMQQVAEKNPSDLNAAMANVTNPGAVVSGILSDARDQAIYEAHSASDQDFNDAVGLGDKWAGRGLGMAVGAATSTAAPIVGTIAGWAVEDIQEIVVDHVQKDTSDHARNEASEKYMEGRNAVTTSSVESLRRALANSGRTMSEDDFNVTAGAVELAAQNGYSAGTTWNSSVSNK